MDDSLVRRLFLEPSCPQQRQYEALRAVFIDGLSQKDAARRFGYSHGAFRLLVGQVRAACAAGQPPPFSPSRAAAGRRAPPTRRPGPTSRRSPTPGRSAWRRGDASAAASPASSFSCRCWPGCAWTCSPHMPATPAPP